MQVMPSLGRSLARARNFPVWDPVLLYQPDVNLQLGMIHLEELLERQEYAEHVLAAYNAGGSRLVRWKDKAGAGDPEIFTERIPYVETRDYVRIVLRNEELYRALYAWRQPPRTSTTKERRARRQFSVKLRELRGSVVAVAVLRVLHSFVVRPQESQAAA